MKKYFICFIFLFFTFICIFLNKYNIIKFNEINTKIYKTKFYNEVLISQTPLKDYVNIAKSGIKSDEIIKDLYYTNHIGLYENIYFDLTYDKKLKKYNIKRIYLQGVGTQETKCWKYLEQLNIFANKKDLFGLNDNNSICIDDNKDKNALSLDLNIDDNGRLLSKKIYGNTLLKKSSDDDIIIKFYIVNNKLEYTNNKDSSKNLYVEKTPNQEIYKDQNGKIINIYTANIEFSKKYNQEIIKNIIVKNSNDKIIEKIIFDYN